VRTGFGRRAVAGGIGGTMVRLLNGGSFTLGPGGGAVKPAPR
jgi:hypothetical protein